jgi:hypothetical protein
VDHRPMTLFTENGGNTKLRPSNGFVVWAGTYSEVTRVAGEGAWRDSIVPLPMPGYCSVNGWADRLRSSHWLLSDFRNTPVTAG